MEDTPDSHKWEAKYYKVRNSSPAWVATAQYM